MSHATGDGQQEYDSQKARAREIRSVRLILLIIGILHVMANLGTFFVLDRAVAAEIEAQRLAFEKQGVEVTDAALLAAGERRLRWLERVLTAGASLGLGFIVLAVLARRFPLPCSIAGVVLYLSATAIACYFDPATLTKGWIVKALIVAGLFKAIQSALVVEHYHDQSESSRAT